MRLHRLEVTAFGPYADTQTVDFDALNEAGVFLMTGPTGAGKTSILDAVCFALYSVVPGDREVRGLRSDHAPADRAPRVELELTLGGRRLRVVRTPEWHRPKRRGAGTTKEQASARLFVIDPDGTEHLVSDRAQEVGHELGLMLGMTSEQFMQVVLLPQSGFQTFLKARSDERRDVLERLFATQRFSRIEDWMHERAREVRDRAAGSLAEVRTAVALLRDRSGTALPEDVSDPQRPEDGPSVASWSEQVLTDASARVEQLAGEVRLTRESAHVVERVAAETRRLHLLAQRRDRAREERAELDQDTDAAQARAAAIAADVRARQVAPLLPPLDRAASRATAAALDVDRARAAFDKAREEASDLGDLAGSGSDPAAESLLAELVTLHDDLRALRPRAADLARWSVEAEGTSAALEAALVVRDRVASDRETLPLEREQLDRELAETTARAARLEAALQRHEEAVARVGGARAHAALLPRVRAAEDAERDAHARANEARGHALDLVARRLDGMAAELAGALQDGEACQVCGSTEHPEPARAVAEAVTEQEQHAAAEAAEDARLGLERTREVVTELRAEAASALQRAGGLDVEQAEQSLRDAEAAVQDARTADAERRQLTDRREALDLRLAETTRVHEAVAAEVADLTARLATTRSSIDGTAGVVRAALGAADVEEAPVEHLPGTLEDRLAVVGRLLTTTRAVVEAETSLQAACDVEAEAADEADAAARRLGFATVDDARDALLDPAERDELEALVRDRESAVARVAGVLAEPELRELDAWTEPDQAEQPSLLDGPPLAHGTADLAQAEARAAEARQAHARAVAQHEEAGKQVVALRAQADQLAGALAAWAPAEAQAATVTELASLVRGSGDNRLRMRLSSYVLATRLDQVLDAANGRLSHMRDTRYLLRRTDKARRANAQAGLDLEVLDEWTGEVRPPSSLSGGECFVVSLALALGLADVIGEESGGLEVDTLFIDEGFGSLDPETLDQVMDRIDELRSGGRAVGVVSHVSELRSRIPTQVHVSPSRAGSRIAIARADA